MTEFSFPEESEQLQAPVVRCANRFVRFYIRGYHRLRVAAPPVIPARGPAILVCNHVSGLDPFLLQSVLDRGIIWMMAKEYYDFPAMSWFYKSITAIPVARSGRDVAATRAALRALELNRVVGIFPEGRIALRGQVLPFQTGVGLLALKSGAPVYPVYLEGSMYNQDMMRAFLLPHRITLAFGPAVEINRADTSRQGLETATQQIHAAVLALRDRHSTLTLTPPVEPSPRAVPAV